MFKSVNLEQELIASKKELLTAQDRLVVKEADKLIQNNSPEDIEILRKMGLDYSIQEAKRTLESSNIMKELDYSRIFTRDEIKDLCITYGLRFLPLEYFKGEVDSNLPSKVKEFISLYNNAMGDKKNSYGYEFRYNKFKICAPKESFNLSDRPVDPLLFYPIEDDKFFLAHKWGSDISSWNAFKNWRKRSIWHWALYSFALFWLPLVSLIFMLCGTFNVPAVLSLSLVGVFAGRVILSSDDFHDYFSNNNWNSEFN